MLNAVSGVRRTLSEEMHLMWSFRPNQLYTRNYPIIPVKIMYSFIHSPMAPQPFVGPWPLLQFRNLFYIVCSTPWTSDQPVARRLSTHRATHTQKKSTHTSMPSVGFELTIPAFQRAKKVHALDRAGTVIGKNKYIEKRNVIACMTRTNITSSSLECLIYCFKWRSHSETILQ
jgi:hypothetical protein